LDLQGIKEMAVQPAKNVKFEVNLLVDLLAETPPECEEPYELVH